MGATSLKMGKSENQCDFSVSEKRGETTFFWGIQKWICLPPRDFSRQDESIAHIENFFT